MAELPSGPVTFVFTDVEGSTLLLKRLRERYGEALTAHQRIVREAFERHGGRELDTQGDAFFYAFPRAREAVLAALAAQRALREYGEWPDQAEFKVRMGIHTGNAEISEDRYTGLAVHRASRICAAAHGGQVLLSQATETLLADEEEDLQVSFRPLGQHRLKDLDRPVSLYQVETADLPRKFPPPREQVRLAAWWRRPLVLVPAALALAAIATVVAVVALGSGGGGLSQVDPNNVGIIDAKTNQIVAQVPVGLRPGPIATRPDAVWVGNLDDRSLTRIDPSRRTSVANPSLYPGSPTGLAVTPDAVWVVQGRVGSVTRIDPQYNLPAEEPRVVTDVGGDGAIVYGGGSVWAVFDDSTLVRIDPSNGRIDRSYAGNVPSGIEYGAGSVWVVDARDNTVLRFDPETFTSGFVDQTSVGSHPASIAYGEDSIWVANAGDGTVSRIDPSSNTSRAIEVGERPSAIAIGGGAAWVANAGDGTVSRIDPETNAVAETIRIGNLPAGLAVSGGFVWITVQKP